MAKLIVTHDTVTGKCELSSLRPYPIVISEDGSVDVYTSTEPSGMVVYNIEVADNFVIDANLNGTTLTIERNNGLPDIDVDLSQFSNPAITPICDQFTEITQTQVANGYDIPAEANILICDNGNMIAIDAGDLLSTLCTRNNLPDLSNICGTPSQLVLVNDGSCLKLATYSGTSLVSGGGDFRNVASHLPPDTTGYIIPTNFANPTDYYNLADFHGDDNNGAGILNETRILNSRVCGGTFVNPCQRRFTLTSAMAIFHEPTADIAYDALCYIFYRYSNNGGPWVYPRVGSGAIPAFAKFNALNELERTESFISLPAGTIEFELFYVAEQTGNARPPVRILATTYPRTGGLQPGQPNFTITPTL